MKYFAVMFGLLISSPSFADVKFASPRVVGWNDELQVPIVIWGSSAGSHVELGGMYTRVTPERMKKHDLEVYSLGLLAGYSSKLPESANNYHVRRMKTRCAGWKSGGSYQPVDVLCKDYWRK